MSDIFSGRIRQHLLHGYRGPVIHIGDESHGSDGHRPRRGTRPRNWRKVRVMAFTSAMTVAVLLWVVGGIMTTAAALWQMAH